MAPPSKRSPTPTRPVVAINPVAPAPCKRANRPPPAVTAVWVPAAMLPAAIPPVVNPAAVNPAVQWQ